MKKRMDQTGEWPHDAVRSTRRAARRELDTLFVSTDSSDFF